MGEEVDFLELARRIKNEPPRFPFEEFFNQYSLILKRTSPTTALCEGCSKQFTATKSTHVRQHFDLASHDATLESRKVGHSAEIQRTLKNVKDPRAFIVLNGRINCAYCKYPFKTPRTGTLNIHLKSHRHSVASEITNDSQFDALTSDEFNFQFVEFLLTNNIPFVRVNSMKSWLSRGFKRPILCESTYRKYYLPKVFEKYNNKVLEYIRQHKIFVSIDETTDSQGRIVTVIIIGTLEVEKKAGKVVGKPGKVFLFDLVEFPRNANNELVSNAFEDAMRRIYPDGNTDSILLFVTDAASYMKLSAKNLQKKYKKMVFVTCLAHGVHRIASEIPHILKEAHAVVTSCKAVFLKSNERMHAFRHACPNIPRPPKPAATRWGTVLTACEYYANYFDDVKGVVDPLKENAASVTEAKKAMSNRKAKSQLETIPLP